MTQPFTFMFSEKQLAIIEHSLDHMLESMLTDEETRSTFARHSIDPEDVAELQAAVCARLAW